MNCEQMTVLLSAWLDGELTQQEERQMQEHLEQCAQCRVLFEQLKALHTSFSNLEELPAPENFTQNVMAKVKAEPKVVPLFQRPALRSLAGLAACALLCIGFARLALDMGFDKSAQAAPEASAPAAAAPESAEPEAAAYDAESYEMPAPEHSVVEEPAETAPEMELGADVSPAEPAAPAPEPVTGEGSASKHLEDSLQGAESRIILRALPGELEEELGALHWEQRVSDGALCAPLTEEQAQVLMAFIDAGELDADFEVPPEETNVWVLVLRSE